MLRALSIAALVLLIPALAPAARQATGVLRITVTLVDPERGVTPVPRHALLISDNPPSAAPRRILTAADGTARVMLRPGNYTVESDQPVAFRGRFYEWTQTVDIAAGRDAVLTLSADNADVLTPSSATSPAPESDPSFLLARWQDSVVTLWTPTTRGSGFVVDARGLVATSQRAIGGATRVEVQITPAIKVAARVLVADPARDVAVLWIDREGVAGAPPVPLGCELASRPAVASREAIFTIGAPLRGPKQLTSGTVGRVAPQSISASFEFDPGGPGGPVFTAAGGVIGITSMVDDPDDSRRDQMRVVPADAACAIVASAATTIQGAPAPDGTRLPVEPLRPFPLDALRDAAARRAGTVNPYQLSSSDFDIALITPVALYAAQTPSKPASLPRQGHGTPKRQGAQTFVQPLTDFGNWSEYVATFPPVLFVRVTPRLVEGFWTKVARAAASTQGVALPPIKRLTAGFARLRAFCGAAEVTPIHPFMIVQRVSESDAIGEGLYVFDPAALGPHCGTVRLELYAEKAPAKADTRAVDAKVLDQIWQDFAPYRAAAP